MQIRHYALLSTFILLAFVKVAETVLSGKTCSVKKSKAATFTAYQQKRQSRRYTTKCGFLNLKRCTRYRDYYVRVSVNRIKTVYYTDKICCQGWRTSRDRPNYCGIHDKFPIVVSCPSDKKMKATGKLTMVHWEKPRFREVWNYSLAITSTYGAESARLPWGESTIKYVATSKNNNKQARCQFQISLRPPDDKPEILNYTNGGSVVRKEHDLLTLTCRALYGNPPSILQWIRNGVAVKKGTSYTTRKSDYRQYKHAYNTLSVTVTRADDDSIYQCTANKPSSFAILKTNKIKLTVLYEVPPVVRYCPVNLVVNSSSRFTNITWIRPEFDDPRRNDSLEITSNIGSSLQSSNHFSWGVHTVIYRATNKRNRLKSSCTFSITIKPLPCKQRDIIPKNGALVCLMHDTTYMHVCQPVCPSDMIMSWPGPLPMFFVCASTGQWLPKTAPLSCTEGRGFTASRGSPYYKTFYNGTCSQNRRDMALAAQNSLMKSRVASSLLPRKRAEESALGIFCG